MKKLLVFGLTLVLASSLSGCGSMETGTGDSSGQTGSSGESSQTSTQQPLTIVESTFWPSEDLDSWKYLVLIENPNENIGWLDESFVVEAFDSDAVLLDSAPHFSTVMPGATIAITGVFYSIGGSSAISELSVRMTEEGVNTDPLGEVGSVTFSDVSFENDSWISVVSGIAASTFAEDKEYLPVIAVIRDKNGKVVDAELTVVDRLPAGGKARFEVNFFDLKIKPNMTIETYSNW